MNPLRTPHASQLIAAIALLLMSLYPAAQNTLRIFL